MTLAELVDDLVRRQHKKCAYQSVVRHLSQFIKQDVGRPKTLDAGECMIPIVPEEIIEEVIDEIHDRIDAIDEAEKLLTEATVSMEVERGEKETKKRAEKEADPPAADPRSTARAR